jgi:hypothetical protein
MCSIQEFKGFTFVTLLDFNIEHYTIHLDQDTHNMCVVILPLGKCVYM